MEIDRAAKFGAIGSIGVILVMLGTFWLGWEVWADRISGQEGKAMGNIMIIGVSGTAVTIMFLFVVIGEYVDRELQARGLDNVEE